MNENLQKLEVKIENQGSTPQGKVSAAEWNILVAAVKALDAAGIDTETLAKYLKQYQYITTPELEELLKDVTENLDGVVDLKSAQTIEGLKDFIIGFKIGGALVKYDTAKKCFIFTENVLMEKGVAWNSRFEDFTEDEIFSITKAVDVDWKTIGKNSAGQLYVINGGGEGGGGDYDPDFLHNYLTNNKYITESALTPYAKTAEVNSLLTEYLPKTGGTVSGNITAPKFIGALEGNAHSATKLATPRTIWGQSFDGTEDVSGFFTTFEDMIINVTKYINKYWSRGIVWRDDNEEYGNLCYASIGGEKWINVAHGAYDSILGLRILTNGNVVVGGTTADAKLHVYGNILASGNVSAQNVTATTNVTATNALIAGGTAYASALKAKSICIECDENGAYKSTYDYEINCFDGPLYIQNSGGYNLYLGDSGEKTIIKSTLEVKKAATFESTLSTGGDTTIGGILTATTQMMIGSYDAPSQALEVRGNILATGQIAWNSSRVLKTEVKEHYLSLENMEQIKPYSYKWKDGRDDLVHVGAIADEVMVPLPETVLTDSLGIHSMDYAQTAFVMAASLTPHVSDHERRIKELETENVALKREIEKLKRVA